MKRVLLSIGRFGLGVLSTALVLAAVASVLPAVCLLALAYVCWPYGAAWSVVADEAASSLRAQADRPAGAVAAPLRSAVAWRSALRKAAN